MPAIERVAGSTRPIADAIDVACGDRHTCVLHAGGARVSCAGLDILSGTYGGDVLSTGAYHTCFRYTHPVFGARVACAGTDGAGQLGDGTSAPPRPARLRPTS